MNADDHTPKLDCKSAPHDPWEDHETAQLRDFLKLSYTERFHLMMQALEFMNMLRPIESKPPDPNARHESEI